jgi:hypothetical protein
MNRLLFCCAAPACFYGRKTRLSCFMNREPGNWGTIIRRTLGALLAIAVLFASDETKAVSYSFTNIVDTTIVGPTGSTFTKLDQPTISGDMVAFVGTYNSGHGIFRGNGGSLTTIVKKGESGPAGSFGFVAAPSISGDNVAFYGGMSDSLQTSGIFVGSGGQLITIALARDSAPIGEFFSFDNPSSSGGNVAFFASFGADASHQSSGIFVGSGGSLTTISKSGDPAPLGTFSNFQDPAIRGDTVAFVGHYVGSGVFVGNGGPLTIIAKSDDPAPFGTFINFSWPSISGNNVAFIGSGVSSEGVFMASIGDPVEAIITLGDPAPVGVFNGFRDTTIGGNTVAFLGVFGETPGAYESAGIFTSADGLMTTVIKTGDPLFGSTVELFSDSSAPAVVLDPSGTGSIAFRYLLADGRWGVGLARPVPEPSMTILIGVTAAAMSRKSKGTQLVLCSQSGSIWRNKRDAAAV